MKPWEEEEVFRRLKELDSQNRTIITMLSALTRQLREHRRWDLKAQRDVVAALKKLFVPLDPVDEREVKDFIFNQSKHK